MLLIIFIFSIILFKMMDHDTILNELGKKAEQGVDVKILYDDMGSRGLRKKGLRPFRNKGGRAEAFFPSKLPLINLRMNNRNHRKIVVIDGQIRYVGGFNVGDPSR